MVIYEDLKKNEKVLLLSCGLNEAQIKEIYNMVASKGWTIIFGDIKEFVIRIFEVVNQAIDPMINALKELNKYMDRENLIEGLCYSLKPIKYLSKCKNYNINRSVKRLNKLNIQGNRLRSYEELEET